MSAATGQRDGRAVREYHAAVASLANAEDLLAYMEAGQQANFYVYEATCRATILVAEMKANLQDVMDRWTPEQCGLGPS